MEIKTISPELQSYLRSGFTIVSPSQTVLELVFNALDAEAKSVAIRAELKSSFMLQVIDDGFGVSKDQLDLLGQRYMTSKCHSLSDLSSRMDQYGYRGEFLASLRDACEEVIIISRAKGNKKTYTKVLKAGHTENCEESSLKRNCHGVTVIVKNFLCNYPVRQRNIKHHLELEHMKKQIIDLCVMHPQVSFTIRDDTTKNVILQIKKRQTAREQILSLISSTIKFESSLIHVTLNYKDFIIDGHISREPISQPEYQNIYVNKRMIVNTILHESLNKLLVKSFYLNITKESNKLKSDGRAKFSVYFINISCPYKQYEVVFQPTNENRTFIEFTNWKKVFKVLEMFVGEFLKTEDFVNHEGDDDEHGKESKEFVEKDGQVVKKVKYNEDTEQNQMESKDENDSLHLVNDYSLKMVEHFQEHTRKAVKREKIENVEKEGEQNISSHGEENAGNMLENVAEIRPVFEDQVDLNEINRRKQEVNSNYLDENCCTSGPEVSVKEQIKEKYSHVISLRSKIKQLKDEIQKRKEIKNMSVFHDKRKIWRSVEKRSTDVCKSAKSIQRTKHQIDNVPKVRSCEDRRSPARGVIPSYQSKETLKNWSSSTKRSHRSRKEISNESILTQVMIPKPKKRAKKSKIKTHEPQDVITHENILTGVNSLELAKHYKKAQESDQKFNLYENVPNESCDFDKLYEVCNSNLFRWLKSDDGLFVNHTPHNVSKVELTPIKVKRKNMKKEIRRAEKQRENGLNQNDFCEDNLSAKRRAIIDIKPSTAVRQNVCIKDPVEEKHANSRDIPHRKRNSAVATKEMVRELNREAKHKILHRVKVVKETSTPVCADHSSKPPFRPKAKECIDKFHYNPILVNGHFVEDIRTKGEHSGDLRKRKANTIKRYLSKKHLKMDQRKAKNSFRDGGLSEQNCSCVMCLNGKHRPVDRNVVDDELVPYEDFPKPLGQMLVHKNNPMLVPCEESPNVLGEMLADHEYSPINLDEYVNDILSRSYRSRLQMDSQEAHRGNCYHQTINPYESHDQNQYMEVVTPDAITPRMYNYQAIDPPGKLNKDVRVHDENFRMMLMESPNDLSKISTNVLEDIWEDNAQVEHRIESFALRTTYLSPARESCKSHRQSSKTTRLGKHVSETPVCDPSHEPFSPYFNRSHVPVNCQTKLAIFPRATIESQATDQTLMNNLAYDGEVFMPKWNSKMLILNSSFFRKKYCLTPVLQSSNSNNQQSAEPEFNHPEGPHEIYRQGCELQQTTASRTYPNVKMGCNEYRDYFPKRNNMDEHETSKRNSRHTRKHNSSQYYQKQQDPNYESSEVSRYDANTGHVWFFDEEPLENVMKSKKRKCETQTRTKIPIETSLSNNRNSNLWKDNQWNSKSGPFEQTQIDTRKDVTTEKIVGDNHDGFYTNAANTEPWTIQNKHDQKSNTQISEERNLSRYVKDSNSSDTQRNKDTNAQDMEDDEIYNVYKSNIAKWFTPVENIQKKSDNTVNKGDKVQEVFENDANDIENNFQFNPKISNEEFDTEQIFEAYRVRNFNNNEDGKRMDENNIAMKEIGQGNQCHFSKGDDDLVNTNKIIQFDVDEEIQEEVLDKEIILEPTHEFASVDSEMPYENEIPQENPIQHAKPNVEMNNTLALADTEPLAFANTEIFEEDNPDKRMDQEQIPIPANKETGQTIPDNTKYNITEILGGSLIFNRLGVVAEIPNKLPAPVFQLKDRYSFMHKGLSPLVLPQNGPELGQLERSELEHLEDILPSPIPPASVDNNCIDKIVSMEEVLVRTNVRSSMLNTMCHVTKDLLNVTFKVIAQVDQKYIMVLLDKTLLVAFDQHAVDERIRVEKLMSYYRNPEDLSLISHPITPCVLNMSRQEIDTLYNRRDCLAYYGVTFHVKKTAARCVIVTHIPKCLFVKLQKETNSTERQKVTRVLILDLIKEIVFCKPEPRGVIPASLIQIINMEACRGAIMFGQTLSLATCYTLIKSLTRCKAPFQCAHGRPSVAPLADVKRIGELVTSRQGQD